MVTTTGLEPICMGFSSLPVVASGVVLMPLPICGSPSVCKVIIASTGKGRKESLCGTVRATKAGSMPFVEKFSLTQPIADGITRLCRILLPILLDHRLLLLAFLAC